ncbi:MAG: NAD-dependent epimerase/dehydratase family protein [Candidatus Lindowbacteria bacterium]|nr:NAD-dependent epimerase/dehydratase family protein [Candidatus Lindowbacteria bacterium]
MSDGKKRILVCGATGFIGRNIAEYYAAQDDCEVIGTYLKSEPYECENLKLVKVDLRNADEVDAIVRDVDVIIQAAATTSGASDIVNRPYIHVTDNAVMNALIFRSAFDRGVKHVIFFSCTVMYQPSEAPVKETDFDANNELLPNYFGVGWTKIYTEKMCEFYSRLETTKYTVLRHSNVYGPHDKFDLERSHVFGATMTKVLKAEDGRITVWGTGEEGRDLIYISDIVDFVRAAEKQQTTPFELVNVGLGRSTSIKELVNKVIEASGKEITVELDTSKPSIKYSFALDTSKAKQLFGWEPKVSLEDGIEKTMNWYKENLL